MITDPTLVRIGAMTRHREMLESDALAAVCPIFRDAERVIADPWSATAAPSAARCARPIRPRICHGVHRAGRGVPGAGAVGRTRDRDRRLPGRAVRDHRWRTTRCWSRSGSRCGTTSSSAYAKVERRVGDWAVAAAGAAGHARQRDDHRRRPRRPHRGQPRSRARWPRSRGAGRQARTEEVFAEAGRRAAHACEPVTDIRGTAEYKRHLAAELTVRTLRTAVDGCRQQGTDRCR